MKSVLDSIRILHSLMSARRRWQLLLVILATLVGAAAEFFSLAAVIPFLTLLADPQRIRSFPLLPDILSALGWSSPSEVMLLAVLVFAVSIVLAGFYRVFLLSLGLRFTFALGREIGAALYQRVLHQPYSFHVNTNSSEILAGLQKVDSVVFGAIQPLIQGTVAGFFSISILVALMWVDFAVALSAMAGFVLIYVVMGRVTGPVLKRSGEEMSAAVAQKIRVTQEGLGGIRDVLIDGTQKTFVHRFHQLDVAQRNAQRRFSVYAASPRYLVEMAGMILIGSLALFMARQSGGMAAALPVLGVLAMGAQRLLPQIQMLYGSWASLMSGHSTLEEVASFVHEPLPLVHRQPSNGIALALDGALVLEQIGFRYSEQGPWVLQGIYLTLPLGVRAGFVGRTGGGKTTLVDIIMGLLEPVQGHIRVGDQTIDHSTLRAWQDRISHVPQFIFLADASMTDNIAFGVPKDQVNMERVKRAAGQAQIDAFIETLPYGYDTEVGERGVRLSGGQRQRIGLARALYKDISLLILDEATSALDDQTESAVMDAVYALGRDITVLMVAHRTSTLRRCDVVYEVGSQGVHAIDLASREAAMGAKG
jgi:ABC-type multidrug transport system fused ATPase/permease subunit